MTRLFRRVLVPYDFSQHATRALRVAAELAAADGGRLVVLHALPPLYPVVGVPVMPLRDSLPQPSRSPQLVGGVRERLAAVVARAIAGRRSLRAECRVVIAEPVQAILDAARGASAIVMGTFGRTGLPHLLIGSVAEKTVRHSPVPVLTIRPRAMRASAARRARRRRRAAT
jgi:nucleotide-binding universal stress UspA family protein